MAKPTSKPTDDVRDLAELSEDALKAALAAKITEIEAREPAGDPGREGDMDAPADAVRRKGPSASRANRLIRLGAEKARRDFETLKLYEPYGDQAAFHACRATEVVLRGGNRSGKSTAAFVELARAITGQDPHGKYPLTGGVAAIVGYDEKHCKNVFYPRLLKSVPEIKMIRDLKTGRWRSYRPWEDFERIAEAKPAPPMIPPRMISAISWLKKSDRIFSLVRLTNGWELNFYSSKSKPPQGFSADLVLIDEDIEDEEWVPEMEARLSDRKGRLIWSALPKSRNRALLTMSRRAWQNVGRDNPDVVEFVLRFRANPHIDDDEKRKRIEGWAAQGSEVLRMRDSGEYILDEYKVFPEFSVATHCVERDAKELETGSLPESWTRYAVIDPGYATCAVLFATVSPPEFGDYVYLEDELYMKNCSDKEFAKNMAAKTQGRVFQAFIIDDKGSARSESNGRTIRRQFTDALREVGVESRDTGFGFILGSTDKESRIAAVHSWLAPRSSGAGPKLRVVRERMPNFLMEMEGYMKKRSGKVILDQPDDRRDNHLMHGLQYLAACRAVRFVKHDGPKKRRKNRVLEYMADKKRRGRSKKDFINVGAGQ